MLGLSAVMTKSRAIAKKTAAVFLSVNVIGSGIYVLWVYETGRPPFCSGYPPGGDCPGNYSNAFQISANYTGSWRATYYGYHSVGDPLTRSVGSGTTPEEATPEPVLRYERSRSPVPTQTA